MPPASSAAPATSAAQRFSILADLGIFPQDSAPSAASGAGAGTGAAGAAGAETLQDGAGNGQYTMMVRGREGGRERCKERLGYISENCRTNLVLTGRWEEETGGWMWGKGEERKEKGRRVLLLCGGVSLSRLGAFFNRRIMVSIHCFILCLALSVCFSWSRRFFQPFRIPHLVSFHALLVSDAISAPSFPVFLSPVFVSCSSSSSSRDRGGATRAPTSCRCSTSSLSCTPSSSSPGKGSSSSSSEEEPSRSSSSSTNRRNIASSSSYCCSRKPCSAACWASGGN